MWPLHLLLPDMTLHNSFGFRELQGIVMSLQFGRKLWIPEMTVRVTLPASTFFWKELVRYAFVWFMLWKLMDNTYIENFHNVYIFVSLKNQSTLETPYKNMPLMFFNWSIYKNRICELELTGMNLIIYLTTLSFILTVFPRTRHIAWPYLSSLILIWSRWCLTKIVFVPHARCIVYHRSLQYPCSVKLSSFSSEKVF